MLAERRKKITLSLVRPGKRIPVLSFPVSSCHVCPFVRYEDNSISVFENLYRCSATEGWKVLGSVEDFQDNIIPIPEWCPLPDYNGDGGF